MRITSQNKAMDFGFLFDWDGVVIDSHAQHELSWQMIAEEMSRPLPDGFFKKTFGMRNVGIIPMWLPETEGDAAAIQRIGDRKEELYRMILRRDGLSALPGVKAFLQQAKADGIPRCVGSSTPRANIEAVVEMTGLEGLFDDMVCAEDVSRGKPAPDVFLKGAEKIGRDPSRCVVFEDAFVGLEAGRSGGMKTVAIATTNPIESLSMADWAVHSLEGITPAGLLGRVGLR